LRKRFGEKQVTHSKKNRILVVESNGRLTGLIVDSASDVLKISAEDVEPPPAVFQEGGLNCVTGLGKYKTRLIVLLDMNKLLQHSSPLREEKSEPGKPGHEARGAAAGRP
jgi:purine-binding chemotaxis protein CheW